MALEGDGHEAITFASFSCSGAKIESPWGKSEEGGLLDAQKGIECAVEKGMRRQNDHIIAPQVQALSRELRYATCMYDGGEPKPCERYAEGNTDGHPNRDIDLLFVSIGGNDIGFAKLVASAFLKGNTRELADFAGFLPCDTPEDESCNTRAALDALSGKYWRLRNALEEKIFAKQSDPARTETFLIAYPQMGYDSHEKPCVGAFGMDLREDFKMNPFEIERIEEKVIPELISKMRSFANAAQWHFVEETREMDCDDDDPACFTRHGVCARQIELVDGVEQAASFEQGSVPRRSAMSKDGLPIWTPYVPSDYRGYGPKTRRYRSPNDIFMTVNAHVHALPSFPFGGCQANLFRDRLIDAASVVFAKEPFPTEFQLFLASFIGGAFHPNAEGHAVMAEPLASAVRAVPGNRRE